MIEITAMNVLIADSFDSHRIAQLKEHGCDVTHEPSLGGDALRDAISQHRPRVLIVRGTKVTADMFKATAELSVVVRAGAGVNTIDLEAASRQGVLVANCPGKNAIAVAELTMGLILALDRRIVEGVNDLRSGKWNKKEYGKARGLKGRTLGVVGTGPIGQAVIARALAFEMPVVAWSRSLTDERAESLGAHRVNSVADVADRCDILSIHVASAPETKNLISRDVLRRLKPGSYVINTARADVLDYVALAELVTKHDLRVGLDVYPDEPGTATATFTDGIVNTAGVVYGTHHCGASTEQAQSAIGAEAVDIVTHYMHTGRVRNCVNINAKTRAKYVVVVRHRNRPGVLAHTLHAISHAGVNVEEMDNIICKGAETACAQIQLDAPLDDAVVTKIKSGNEHVLAVTQAKLPSS